MLSIAERLQAPVVLTPMAKGMLSEDHPLYAGVFFHALSDVVAQTYGQADLVLAVGYDPIEFNYEQWMPAVPLISLDTLPVDIDRAVYPEIVDVVGDIPLSLDYIAGLELTTRDWDVAALAERRASMFARMSPSTETFGPCAALEVCEV